MATTPQSATQLFDDLLPKALEKNPDKAAEIGAKYVFKVGGEGDWTVNLTSNPPTVTKGVEDGAQCTIEIQGSDFTQLLGNPAMGMQLFFAGKLKVTGDQMLAMKLQKLFQLA